MPIRDWAGSGVAEPKRGRKRGRKTEKERKKEPHWLVISTVVDVNCSGVGGRVASAVAAASISLAVATTKNQSAATNSEIDGRNTSSRMI